MIESEPTTGRGPVAAPSPKRDPARIFKASWEWEHLAVIGMAAFAVAGVVVVLLASDDRSAFEIAIVLVVVTLALASLFLTVEARRRRIQAYAQLLRSVTETTVDMHAMMRRFRNQDVDPRLLDDAHAALVDAGELQVLLGRERPELAELGRVADDLQRAFAIAPSPIATASTPRPPGTPS